VVWEPFGGLASAAVAAVALGRRAYVAEIDPEFAKLAYERLRMAAVVADADLEEEAIDMGVDASLLISGRGGGAASARGALGLGRDGDDRRA
jgi:hypothetical protein